METPSSFLNKDGGWLFIARLGLMLVKTWGYWVT